MPTPYTSRVHAAYGAYAFEAEVVIGIGGIRYLRFHDDVDATAFCEHHRISPALHCVGGYMNGISVSDLNHATNAARLNRCLDMARALDAGRA